MIELIKISQESRINEISNSFNIYRIQVKEEVGNEVKVCWSEVICFAQYLNWNLY